MNTTVQYLFNSQKNKKKNLFTIILYKCVRK